MPGIRDLEASIDSMFGTGDANASDSDAQSTVEGAEGNEDTTQQSTESADTAGAQQTDAAGQSDGSDKPAASSGDATKPGAQPAAQRTDTQGKPQVQPRLPANNKGDLVDAAGNVVARAGNERRFYEAARGAQRDVQRVTQELEQVRTQLNTFREAAILPQQLNLAPQEVTAAMQFMAHFKANPVEAAKKVLTEVAAMGHNIDGLNGGIDLAAVKRMVTEAVSPFQQDRQLQAQQAEIAQQVELEIEAVASQFPWFDNQQSELQLLLDSDPSLSLREAALTLQAWAYQHGYDLGQSVRAQHLARSATPPVAQQPAAPTRLNQAQQPTPRVAADSGTVPKRTAIANHDRSNRDIVRETLREFGINAD